MKLVLSTGSYHPPTEQWVPLPQYEYAYFAMVILTDKLMCTLVGGFITSTRQVTNQIAVWDTQGMSQGWTHPYPAMTTPRRSLAVASYDRRSVVAGGNESMYVVDAIATVEVLDTTSHQWLSTSPLPVKCYNMTSVVVSDRGVTRCIPPQHNTDK